MIKTKTIGIGILISISIMVTTYFINETNNEDSEYNSEIIELNWKNSLFKILVNERDLVLVNGKTVPLKADFALDEQFQGVYDKVGVYNLEEKPAVIIPTFTSSAYGESGFYDFYQGRCDESCLTTKILTNNFDFSSSANAIQILDLLGYEMVFDEQIDKDPNILEKYDKIILLHNEYVTKKMFDAITSHPNVIYLYPNALHAEISTDYELETISLVRGHGYPEGVDNGFEWEYDNTRPYEFDTKCNNWEFYSIPNGKMLNCYPEQIIWKDENLLNEIKNQ